MNLFGGPQQTILFGQIFLKREKLLKSRQTRNHILLGILTAKNLLIKNGRISFKYYFKNFSLDLYHDLEFKADYLF